MDAPAAPTSGKALREGLLGRVSRCVGYGNPSELGSQLGGLKPFAGLPQKLGTSSRKRSQGCLDENGQRVPKPGPTDGGDGVPDASDAPDTSATIEDSGEAGVQDSGTGEDAGVSKALTCPWGADAILNDVGVAVPDRINCGFTSGGFPEDRLSLPCFTDGAANEEAVEVSINRCIDCVIQTTYVASGDGQLYALHMSLSGLGTTGAASTRTERCDEIVLEAEDLVCVLVCSLHLLVSHT